MLVNFAGSLAAFGIYRGQRWGWVLGVVMAGGAFLAYTESRTLGLPGLPSWEPFTEPPGLFSLLVEALFVGLAAFYAYPAEEGCYFVRRSHTIPGSFPCAPKGSQGLLLSRPALRRRRTAPVVALEG